MCQTLDDYLSFVTRSLQLRVFNHIMSGIITKSIIYGVINLKFSFSFIMMTIVKGNFNTTIDCTNMYLVGSHNAVI